MNRLASANEVPLPPIAASLSGYAGFWRRLVAHLIDTLALMPAVALGWWVLSSHMASLALVIPSVACGPLYSVSMHARWGQTLGKMAAGIQVVTVTGARISWREALLRDSVGIAFAALATASLMLAMVHLPQAAWHDRRETLTLLGEAQPRWGHWASTASTLWAWGELLVLLFNKQRRALHDFIAGTIVIRIPR